MSGIDELGYDTKAIRLGYKPGVSNSHSIAPPIGLSTTFEQDDPSTNKGHVYIRHSNPTRELLEKGIALLEEAKHCVCFASGSCAIGAITKLLNTGDHIILSEVMYGGTYLYTKEVLANLGITTTYVDATDSKNVEKAIQAKTRLVLLETPANPTLDVIDIAKVADIVHKRKNTLFALDNTFLTSYFQKPLSLGADIVIYSLTKYMNGHSDVCMGSLCFNDDSLLPRFRFLQDDAGLGPSPFDCYLVHRGLKTLPVRMRQHMVNGLKVAQFLESHPFVEKVMHPLLPSHPQHEVAKRQTTGHSGMVAFYVRGGFRETSDVLQALKLFSLAVSLGGVESLAIAPNKMNHASAPEEEWARIGFTDNLVRLSVGIENVEDLIKDLDQALNFAASRV